MAVPDSLKNADLALYVGDTQFPLADSTRDTFAITNDRLTWTNTGLTWTVGQQVSLSIAPPVTDVEVSLSASPNPVLEGQSVGVTARLAQLPAGESRDLRIPLLIKMGTEFRDGSAVNYGSAEFDDLAHSLAILRETTDGSGRTYNSWWLPGSIHIGSGSHQRTVGFYSIPAAQDGDSNDDTFTVLLDTEHPDWPEGVVAGSAASVLITITDDDRTDGPPAAPTDLRFEEGDGRLDVIWKPGPRADAPALPTGYDVHYTLKPDGAWTPLTRSGTETSQTITGLTNGQLVWVRVRAVNANGESDWTQRFARPNPVGGI